MTNERFWSKVDKNGSAPDYAPHLGPCWIWEGARHRLGYGHFMTTKPTTVLAHRWSYEETNGPIPDGLELDHLCRVPSCVRPAHCEPVTHRENLARSPLLLGWAGVKEPRTHCRNGHLYTPETTRPTGNTKYCTLCKLAASRRKRLKAKQCR
jgi:HNH endonuclease